MRVAGMSTKVAIEDFKASMTCVFKCFDMLYKWFICSGLGVSFVL